jgi:hypothetical protein
MRPIATGSSRGSGGAIDSTSRSASVSDTSPCWIPSCRFRSRRRLASSAAATTRALDAVSCARASALEIAIAIRSANLATRSSASASSSSGRVASSAGGVPIRGVVVAIAAPQSRSPMTIGAPTPAKSVLGIAAATTRGAPR